MMAPFQFLIELLERKPTTGYAVAAVSSAPGFLAQMWGIFASAPGLQWLITLFTLISVVIGSAVAAVTLYVQILTAKKLRKEDKNKNEKSD